MTRLSGINFTVQELYIFNLSYEFLSNTTTIVKKFDNGFQRHIDRFKSSTGQNNNNFSFDIKIVNWL